MKKLHVEALFEMAGFKVLSLHMIPNEYWPDSYVERRAISPWWLVETDYGVVKIGWRKKVIQVSWGITLAELEITMDDVTKSNTLVHAYGYAKCLRYLMNLHQVAVETRAGKKPTQAEWNKAHSGRRIDDPKPAPVVTWPRYFVFKGDSNWSWPRYRIQFNSDSESSYFGKGYYDESDGGLGPFHPNEIKQKVDQGSWEEVTDKVVADELQQTKALVAKTEVQFGQPVKLVPGASENVLEVEAIQVAAQVSEPKESGKEAQGGTPLIDDLVASAGNSAASAEVKEPFSTAGWYRARPDCQGTCTKTQGCSHYPACQGTQVAAHCVFIGDPT